MAGSSIGNIQHGGYRDMRIALSGNSAPMPEHMTDEIEAFAVGDGQGGERVAQVMDADIFEFRISTQPLPWLLNTSKPSAGFFARKDECA